MRIRTSWIGLLIDSLGHCQIAAIARANGMTLATNNVAEFGRVSGLLVEGKCGFEAHWHQSSACLALCLCEILPR